MAWTLAAMITGVTDWYAPLLWAPHHGRALPTARAERFVMTAVGIALAVAGASLAGLGA